MANPTDTQNKSNVRLWVDDRIKAGKFKDCTHLKLRQMALAVPTGSAIVYFFPEFDQRSFVWLGPALDDQTRREMLVQSMEKGVAIISCPSECLCYENRAEAELAARKAQEAVAAKEKRKRQWAHIVGPIKAVFNWFSGLSWQAQIALIFLGVLFLSPKWVPQIVSLIKALAQLFH